MPTITLPDGSQRTFDHPVTGFELAGDIGERLQKASLGVVVNGELQDLGAIIEQDSEVSIITSGSKKEEPGPETLELVRHS